MFYDITSTGLTNYSLGKITNVKIKNNKAIVTTDDNTNFSKIKNEEYFIVKRKDTNGIPKDINKPYKITNVDKANFKLTLEPVNTTTYEIDLSITPDIKTNDILYQAGTWKMVLSQSTDINAKNTENITKDDLKTQNVSLETQIKTLQSYLSALQNAGYTNSDPEYIKTYNQLKYYQALYTFNKELIDCKTCDPKDENTWNNNVKTAKTDLIKAEKILQTPPPSTKEIIIQSINKIGLSVMGSIDIYITGHYENPPSPTNTSIPSYISNINITNVHTSHFKGTSVGIKGTNKNLGVNYMLIKASYNASQGGTATVKFTIDVAEAAGISDQRNNYDFQAFSALFKIKERNFWDYTGGNKTWQYFVNMVPVTTDKNSPNWGKYNIECQVSAYKDYHNAIIGARWFATMNKFRGF